MTDSVRDRGCPGLYTETAGRGSDVVLLHGWGLHSGVWDGMVAVFQDRYRLTRIDLPGHGRSPLIADLGDLDAICAILHKAAPAKAAWVGWSLGGLIALGVALRYPRAVSRVVLVTGTPRFTRGPNWPHAVPAETLAAFARDLEEDYETTLRQFLALQTHGSEAGRRSLNDLRTVLFRHPPRPEALRAGLALLSGTDLRGHLSRLACPLRMIFGGRDALAPPGCGAGTVTLARDAQYTILPGAAHAPFLSHPRAFAIELQRFLSD